MLVAGVLAGDRELPGWWGQGRAANWADAIEAARSVGAVGHLTFEVRAAQEPPWHPGRCAALYVHAVTADGTGQEHEWLAGHAGELHPRVIAAYGLPPRTCAFELDFAVLATAAAAAVVRGPALSRVPAGHSGRGARCRRGGARRGRHRRPAGRRGRPA